MNASQYDRHGSQSTAVPLVWLCKHCMLSMKTFTVPFGGGYQSCVSFYCCSVCAYGPGSFIHFGCPAFDKLEM